MYKKCSKCGAEIPKEAAFCLKCFSSVEGVAPQKENTKPTIFFILWSNILKLVKSRRFWLGFASVAVFSLIMGICILAMKHLNSTPPPISPETSILHVTETVAVTQSDGEFVTDEMGEQVFDVIDVTQTITLAPAPTTQKQGFLGSIFNDKKPSDESLKDSTDKEEDTTKKGFWENIFGTEDTTQKATEPTTKPSTTLPTDTTPSTTLAPPTTTTPPTTAAQVSLKDFEYTISGSYATITKYTGNSASVVIPAVIEGCPVTRIKQNTFQNNSSVVFVSFENNSKQPYLWVEPQTFNSCQNLKVISFSETDLGIMNNFATNCLSVENINITSNQYKCIDGTLYYNGGSWKVRYHCPANPATEMRLPNNCAGFEASINLNEARNIKNIYINSNTTSFPSSEQMPPNCENVFVDSGNSRGYDIGGIAFSKNGSEYLCTYPPKNKTQSLTLPENTLIYFQQIKNPNLKTLYIPSSTHLFFIESVLSKKSFSALENLYFGAEHSKASYVLQNSEISNTQLY